MERCCVSIRERLLQAIFFVERPKRWYHSADLPIGKHVLLLFVWCERSIAEFVMEADPYVLASQLWNIFFKAVWQLRIFCVEKKRPRLIHYVNIGQECLDISFSINVFRPKSTRLFSVLHARCSTQYTQTHMQERSGTQHRE